MNSPRNEPGHPFYRLFGGRRENALFSRSIFLVKFRDHFINEQWPARHEDTLGEGQGHSQSTKMWR